MGPVVTERWPRNIVPYDEQKLRALSTVEAVALYEGALDRPLDERDLAPADAAIARELVAAGLFERAQGRLHPTSRHRRDPESDVAGVLEHKRAVVGFAHRVLDDTEAALAARGPGATAALGVVRLSTRPATLARAIAIIAEAEDQLRALAEDDAPAQGEPTMRVMVFAGSTTDP